MKFGCRGRTARVLLDCPALLGQVGEYTAFGRIRTGSTLRHWAGSLDMTPEGDEE